MPKTRGGLGRGIGALIPGAQSPLQEDNAVQPEASGPPQQAVLQVPVERISPNPHQPRQEFKEDALQELAASIREHGVLQPLIVVRAAEPDTYHLVAGERRWRASQLAGLTTVPVIVKETNEHGMLALALVENIQRSDLNPLEEARAYRELMDRFDLTQEMVSRLVGRSRAAVANMVRLLNLPPEIIQEMEAGHITEGHSRAILQLRGREAQLEMLKAIIEQGYSVRQTEEMVRRTQEGEPLFEEEAPVEEPARPARPARARALPDIETNALERQFRDALHTKVDLTRSSKGGKLVIHFFDEETLEQIYQIIVEQEERARR